MVDNYNVDEESFSIKEQFGIHVFNDDVMSDRLPKNVYLSLKRTKEFGIALEPDVADVVANVMKNWAIEQGATHFTHWFHPMTGVTAEKHESFLSRNSEGRVIMEFSGKELIKGEPDASSFPSGGLRDTCEARGYTAWDPTSDAFVKENSLYIPTAFCSFSGEVLDKKTPLLRSMEAVNAQALRILRLFGNTTSSRVTATVGAEQEYFLIDKKLYDKRQDLIFAGRTLFGAKAPKGQEMDDHYYGSIKSRVSSYMRDLDRELWKLGVYSKTKHNEVAPAQHELAPIFASANVAADQNQLTMDVMKKTALRHGLVCLLHEKPFASVSGSGKHNNWSLTTDDGINLLEPGKTPHKNIMFLTFLCAVIKAVDEYPELFRISVASASNDCRLGASEAPPAILSVFVGAELEKILEALESGALIKKNHREELMLGVESLPNFPKDTTDRNRTSPMAFTGNKFEFRMLGSGDSISCANIMMNSTVAIELKKFADRLENANDFSAELNKMLSETVRDHKRIIWGGNNYTEDWVKEAESRGLPNLRTSVDALLCYDDDKNVEMLEELKIFTRAEILSRQEILLENYSKRINIEALTMIHMAKKQILPVGIRFVGELCDIIDSKKRLGFAEDCVELRMAKKLSQLNNELDIAISELESEDSKAASIAGDIKRQAAYYCESVLPAMEKLREIADEIENIVPANMWPFPTYSELMFNV
ncbi:MAG: glutamine synthetase III [Oscillospiraceae bacterium]|nr:glutamine synthetase III [Oscillospiraceae bacterium]